MVPERTHPFVHYISQDQTNISHSNDERKKEKTKIEIRDTWLKACRRFIQMQM
jgi:hypothetical protein